MSRLKRVGVSLLSALAADLIVSVAVSTPALKRDGVVSIFWAWAVMLLLVIPGWILSLPVVLTVSSLAKWRIWLVAIIGSCIGPFVILAIGGFAYLSNPNPATSVNWGAWMAIPTGISVLSTVIYIALLKLGQTRNASSEVPTL